MELKRNPLSTVEMAFENARGKFERKPRYEPHQGPREIERRAKQIAKKAAKEQKP